MEINSGDIVYCTSISVLFEVGEVFTTVIGDRIHPVVGSIIDNSTGKESEGDYDGYIFSSNNCAKAGILVVEWYNKRNTV